MTEFDSDRAAVRFLQGRWRPEIAEEDARWQDRQRYLPYFNRHDPAQISGRRADLWPGFPPGVRAKFDAESGGFRIGGHEFCIVTIERRGEGRIDRVLVSSPGPGGPGRGVGGVVFNGRFRGVKGGGEIRMSALQESGFNLVFEDAPRLEDVALRQGLENPTWTPDFSPGH